MSDHKNNIVALPTATNQSVPEMPWHIKPEPTYASMASTYLDEYVHQASNASPMTPIDFHESAGLILAATAIAGRIATQMDFGTIKPNLYVLWVAPTSVCRKSTALKFMENIADELFPHLLAPGHTTPEAFFSMLAGALPSNYDELPYEMQVILGLSRDFAAQRLVVRDELGGLMDSFARDYNSGLKQDWLSLFDGGDAKRQTKKDGLTWVRNPAMSLIGATTHLSLASHLQDHRNWEDGWWARFGMLVANPQREDPKAAKPSNTYEIRTTLENLNNRLKKPSWGEEPPALTLTNLGKEQFDHYFAYYTWTHNCIWDLEDARLHGLYSRLPTLALKVATILSAVEWAQKGETSSPIITTPHMHRAIQVVEKWRLSTHMLIEKSSETARTKLQESIMRQLARAGQEGVTWTHIWKNHKSLDRNDVRQAAQDLLEAGDLTRDNPHANPNEPQPPGRPKERYWLTVA